MQALAGSILVSVVFASLAIALPTPATQADRNVSKLRSESSSVAPGTTPQALERRFGRDTLLYFPMDKGVTLPVALQVQRIPAGR